MGSLVIIMSFAQRVIEFLCSIKPPYRHEEAKLGGWMNVRFLPRSSHLNADTMRILAFVAKGG